MQKNLIEERQETDKKAPADRKTLYLYMIGQLLCNAAVFIVYNYQNMTYAEI